MRVFLYETQFPFSSSCHSYYGAVQTKKQTSLLGRQIASSQNMNRHGGCSNAMLTVVLIDNSYRLIRMYEDVECLLVSMVNQ